MRRIYGFAMLACVCSASDPKANPASVVTTGNARITMLTERLLRLEWVDGKDFEDRETLSFANRNLPTPGFTTNRSTTQVSISNEFLNLVYTSTDGVFEPFSSSNLKVAIHATGKTWVPGMVNTGNLLGTVESLDGVTGSVDLNCLNMTGCTAHDKGNPSTSAGWPACRYCTSAPISRDGWALYDDTDSRGQSGSAVINSATGWIEPSGRKLVNNGTVIDTYLFAHGIDYKAALRDLTRVTGPPGRIPREVLGTWWSRYWPYTAEELQDIARGYAAHSIPLDMIVSDMAWHFHNESKIDWAGYSWSKELFPAPDVFKSWLQQQGEI
jgi:alpha-glucosidase